MCVDVTVGSAVIVHWACSNKLISDGYAVFQFGSIFSFVKVGTWFMCWKTFFTVGIQLQDYFSRLNAELIFYRLTNKKRKRRELAEPSAGCSTTDDLSMLFLDLEREGAPTQMLPEHTIYLLLLYNWSQINNICLLDNFVVEVDLCNLYCWYQSWPLIAQWQHCIHHAGIY